MLDILMNTFEVKKNYSEHEYNSERDYDWDRSLPHLR
jgi:hypothetical protein